MALGNGGSYSYCLDPQRAVLEGSPGGTCPAPLWPSGFPGCTAQLSGCSSAGGGVGALGSFPRVLSQFTGEQKQMWMGRGPGTTLSIPAAVLSDI